MIFKKLTLKNFKSHKDSTIYLNQGITIILGENGAGKSSILEGISFALFKQHTGKKIDDLVRNNQENKTMLVELEFYLNGRDYKIQRVRNKKSLKSTLYLKDNEKFISLCTGEREVANQIESILNMDSNLFLNAIYIRQGEISQLVDKSPSEKKQLIGKLLGIESLEKAWKNMLPFLSKYENKKAELKGKLHSSNSLDLEYKEKIKDLTKLNEEGNILEKELENVKKFKEEKEKEKEKLDSDKNKFEYLKNELGKESELLNKLNEDKKNIQVQLDEIYKYEEEITSLEKYTKKLPIYLDFEKAVLNIKDLKINEEKFLKDLDSIKNQKEVIEKEKENYEKFLEIEEKIDNLKDDKSKLESDLQIITKLNKDKENLTSEIKKEKEKVTDFFKQAHELLKEENIDEREIELISGCDELNYSISKLIKQYISKKDNIEEEISLKNQYIASYNEAIKNSNGLLEDLKKVDNECPLCKSPIDFKKKVDLTKTYKNNIISYEESIDEINKEIKSLKENKSNFNNKIDFYQEYTKEIYKFKNISENLDKDISKLDELNKNIEIKGDISSKLGVMINLIESEIKNREIYKKSYNEYNKANGALEVLDSENDLEFKLEECRENIDKNVKLIKLAISKDNYLSTDIEENELRKCIDSLKDKETTLNQLKGQVKHKKQLENQLISKKENINLKSNKIELLNNEIKDINYNSDDYNKLVTSLDFIKSKYDEINIEISSIKGQAKEIISQIDDLKEKIDNNAKYKIEYKNISNYLDLLSIIRELYGKNGIQKELRNRSRPLIQKYTKSFFEQFNFNYSDLIINDDYDIFVYGPEGETTLNMVSGGEKIAIALALRLGITQSMSKNNLETILLDEPTVHLDSYRRNELISLLREMKILPQMIIVTHDSQLESAADNIIKVVKDDGISKIELEN